MNTTFTEKLSKNQPASVWIKDFIDSKNSKFKGKTKKERISMALGAYYGAKRNEAYDENSPFKPNDDSIDYDPERLAAGIKVEMEHTDDEEIATIIAKHHLAEDPEYYIKLASCVEEYGAGFEGTDALRKKYIKDTPEQRIQQFKTEMNQQTYKTYQEFATQHKKMYPSHNTNQIKAAWETYSKAFEMEEAYGESWVVYDKNTKAQIKPFKTRKGAYDYAAKSGGVVYSAEYYADNKDDIKSGKLVKEDVTKIDASAITAAQIEKYIDNQDFEKLGEISQYLTKDEYKTWSDNGYEGRTYELLMKRRMKNEASEDTLGESITKKQASAITAAQIEKYIDDQDFTSIGQLFQHMTKDEYKTWSANGYEGRTYELLMKRRMKNEAININDYMATSEKSQFGGYRPHVVGKAGKTMYLGQASYNTPDEAKDHAEDYLKQYARGISEPRVPIKGTYGLKEEKESYDSWIIKPREGYGDGVKVKAPDETSAIEIALGRKPSQNEIDFFNFHYILIHEKTNVSTLRNMKIVELATKCYDSDLVKEYVEQQYKPKTSALEIKESFRSFVANKTIV